MPTYSIIITATITAEDQDDAENAMLALVPFETVEASGVVLLRATVEADGGRAALRLNAEA